MPLANRLSLRTALREIGNPVERYLCGPKARVALDDLIHGSALAGRGDELRGRSVVIATRHQFNAALALVELDGVARRLVLCPSDFRLEHLPAVMDSAGVDVIVSDGDIPEANVPGSPRLITCSSRLVPANYDRRASCETEWVLLTSGTTGLPKLVVHTLETLAAAIDRHAVSSIPRVWSTFYDIRRYGGLQIFLRAVLTGTSLVLSSAQEPTAEFLSRAGSQGVTHISGTPSHWRRALMSPAAHMISPEYIRLSGEIADQAILDHLRSFYENARIVHAFASTEAGVGFDVTDGLAGFPASLIGQTGGVEMKVEDGSLRIRSARTADRYLAQPAEAFRGGDGFVDTGDIVELRGDRYHFTGRRDGVINVGGLKVHPEEVEAVINRHPDVRMTLVRTRKNPITGGLVVADVVLKTEPTPTSNAARDVQNDILLMCRTVLPPHKVPALINFVPALAVADTGKLVRRSA